MSKYINPFTDFGFKKLFGEEDSKDILISFLNDLLPIKDKIDSIEFKKSEQLGFSDISRKAIYDVYCTDTKGNRFIVEMQNASQTYFKDRTIFYSTFPIQEQAKPGDWNFKLTAVYCVSLIKFNKDENNLDTNFDKWLYFLKNLEDFHSIPEILKNSIFEKAFNKAELANFDETQKLDYERSVKIYRDNCNVIQSSFDDGLEKGLEQGLEKGLEQGLEQGRIQNKIENAKNLLDILDDETISSKLDLDIDIVKNLRIQNSN